MNTDTSPLYTLRDALTNGAKRLSDIQNKAAPVSGYPGEATTPDADFLALMGTLGEATPKQRALVRSGLGYMACGTCVTFVDTGVCPIFEAERPGGEGWEAQPVSQPKNVRVSIKRSRAAGSDTSWSSGCDAVDASVIPRSGRDNPQGILLWGDRRLDQSIGNAALDILYGELEARGLEPGSEEFAAEMDSLLNLS
jgi:hypothetical protein